MGSGDWGSVDDFLPPDADLATALLVTLPSLALVQGLLVPSTSSNQAKWGSDPEWWPAVR